MCRWTSAGPEVDFPVSGVALIRAVQLPEMRQSERDFAASLPKQFHSQGTREKVVHLPGGVTVMLSVTYYHRLTHPKNAGKAGRRGLFPMLWLKAQKKRLLEGHLETVVHEIQTLLGPRTSKPQQTWPNDFINHGPTHRRMDDTRRVSRRVDKTTGLRSDQTIALAGVKSSQLPPDPLRRVSYHDAATDRRFVFLTNNVTIPALTVAGWYKSR